MATPKFNDDYEFPDEVENTSNIEIEIE